MKKLLALVCIAALSLSLFACIRPLPIYNPTTRPTEATEPVQNLPPQTEAQTQAPTDASETLPAPTDPVQTQPQLSSNVWDYFGTYWSENISYSDGYNSYNSSYDIPLVLIESADAASVNSEIQSLCVPALQNARQCRDSGTSLIDIGIHFKCWLYGTYASLEVELANDYDCNAYLVYTFDLRDGHLLTISDYAAYTGMSEGAFYETIRSTLQQEFDEGYAAVPEEYKDSFFYDQRSRNADDNNVHKCRPYIGQDGRLLMCCDLYSIAGADCYARLIPIRY